MISVIMQYFIVFSNRCAFNDQIFFIDFNQNVSICECFEIFWQYCINLICDKRNHVFVDNFYEHLLFEQINDCFKIDWFNINYQHINFVFKISSIWVFFEWSNFIVNNKICTHHIRIEFVVNFKYSYFCAWWIDSWSKCCVKENLHRKRIIDLTKIIFSNEWKNKRDHDWSFFCIIF